MRLAGRRVTVTVDTLRVTGLRCVFRAVKTLDPQTPNNLELAIYNLAERTRGAMSRARVPVVVSAGYEGTEAIIFSGDSRMIDHRREGPDWITRVQCGDGERALSFARISESFAPGTSIADVARATAGALGIDLGNLEDAISSGRFRDAVREFASGFSANGKASDELDRVLRTAGLQWSVQDGRLQVLRGDEAAAGTAVLLTPETGLVGSPDHGAPAVPGGPPILRVRSLLQPTIRCGGAIDIRAAGVKGLFRASRVEHSGDTHGADWYTLIEATAIR